MSKFWESLGEKLADRWLQVSIPALVFWLGGLLSWLSKPGELMVMHDKGKQLANQPVLIQALVLVGALLLVGASGEAVQALALPVQRLFEGYWPWPFRALRRRLIARNREKASAMAPLWQRLYVRVHDGTATIDEKEELTRLERRRRQIPYRSDAIMPTRVGNILRAADLGSLGKYGLDPQVLWPHLRQLIPERTRQEFEQAQQALSLNISVLIWAISFTFFGIFTWWPVPLGLVVSIGAFISIPRKAANVADLAQLTWDLYRFELYKKLRFPLPANPKEEQMLGPMLTSYLIRGSDSPKPSFTEAS